MPSYERFFTAASKVWGLVNTNVVSSAISATGGAFIAHTLTESYRNNELTSLKEENEAAKKDIKDLSKSLKALTERNGNLHFELVKTYTEFFKCLGNKTTSMSSLEEAPSEGIRKT